MGKHKKKKKNKKNRKLKQEKLQERQNDVNHTSKTKKECSAFSSSPSISPMRDNYGRSGSKYDRRRSRSRDHHGKSPSRDHRGKSPSREGQDKSRSRERRDKSPSKDRRCKSPSNEAGKSDTAVSKVLIPKPALLSSNESGMSDKITDRRLERKRAANQETSSSTPSKKKSRWSESYCNNQDQITATETNIELFFGWQSPFSQHHPCRFRIKGQIYNCAEQYYMSQKAATFNDKKIEAKVMFSSDPKEQKRFGKQIRGFNDAIWKRRASEVVLVANLAKFEQNLELLRALFNTGDSILAEASPYDKYWGIGLKESDPRAKNMSSWPGLNTLGKILMEVRTKLRNVYSNITEDFSKMNFSCQMKEKESWTNRYVECPRSKADMNITLFFGWQSPFSQHHPCSFTIKGQIYNCAEQYYMSQKAVTFNDKNIEAKVMFSSDPKEQKRFGKQIRGFNDAIWKRRASEVVFDANLAKFKQNSKLYKNLLETGDSILAEASPYDRYWGIGLQATDPRAKYVQSWCGQNILGEILMKVRTKLKDSSGSSG